MASIIVDDDIKVVNEYTYTAISGNRYLVYVRDGKWFIGVAEVDIWDLARLLEIEDEEELIFLRLKYGA